MPTLYGAGKTATWRTVPALADGYGFTDVEGRSPGTSTVPQLHRAGADDER